MTDQLKAIQGAIEAQQKIYQAAKNVSARKYVVGCIEELMRETDALGEDVDFIAAVHAARLRRGGE